jgi:hypothetical protein
MAPIVVEERADRLTRRLDLSAAQRERVLVILRGHQARNQENRTRLVREVREVLDTSQRERFDRFTQP